MEPLRWVVADPRRAPVKRTASAASHEGAQVVLNHGRVVVFMSDDDGFEYLTASSRPEPTTPRPRPTRTCSMQAFSAARFPGMVA